MREDEYSHKGIDRATQIDKAVIESSDYRRLFDNATDNPILNKTLYNCAKEILFDRSGTRYESMRWIDGETGKVLLKFDSMGKRNNLIGKQYELKVLYNESLLQKFIGHNNIVVIHNHPNSTAPSAGDFNSAFKHNYKFGFIAAHNGRVYKYRSNEEIDVDLYDAYWQDCVRNGFDEINAQLVTISKFSENSNIFFTEVLR